MSNFPKIRMRVDIFGTDKCNVTFGLEYTFTPSILLQADILISISLYLNDKTKFCRLGFFCLLYILFRI